MKVQSITKVKLPTTIIAALLFYCIGVVQAVIDISGDIVGANGDYSISVFDFSATYPAGSTIQIQFPLDFSAEALHAGSPYTGGTGASDFCPNDCSSVQISYAGYMFTLTGLVPDETTALMFTFTIVGIPNPQTSLTTSGFTIKVLNPSSSALYTENVNGHTFVENTMDCSAQISSFNATNLIAAAYFQIQPNNDPELQPLSKLQMQFPSSWQGQTESSTTTIVYCTSTSQPELSCSISQNIVTVTNIAYAALIDITVHDIYSPSAVIDAGAVTIFTMTDTEENIEQCQVYITGLEEGLLRLTSLEISYVSDQLIDISYSMTFPGHVPSGILIFIDVPTEMPIGSATCVADRDSTSLGSSVVTYFSSNNTLKINPFTSAVFKPVIKVSCTGVSRPRAGFILPQTTISTYKVISSVSYLEMQSQCCEQLLHPRNSLSVSELSVDQAYLLTAGVTYTFTFTISQYVSLETTDLIYIYFPYQYELTVGSIPCTVTVPADPPAATGSPTCSVADTSTSNPTNTLVKISSFLGSQQAVSSSTTLTITLSSITNPSQDPSSTPFIISTLTDQQQIIETNQNQYATLSAALISSISISPSSRVIHQSGVVYIISLTINGYLYIGYTLEITIPAQIQVDQSVLGCTIGGASSPCWMEASVLVIRVQNSITNTHAITVQISGLTNPPSLEPTSQFDVNIKDTLSNTLQSLDNTVLTNTVTMLTTTQFELVHISMSSSTNYRYYGTLELLLVSPFPITSSHTLQIAYNPSDMLFDQTGHTSICSAPASCTFSASSIEIGGLVAVDGSQVISFSITNCLIMNQDLSIDLKLISGTNYDCLDQTITQISQIVPNTITYTVSQSSWVMGDTPVDITIDYTLSQEYNSSDLAYILVYVPQSYSTSAAGNIYNSSTFTGQILVTGATNPTTQVSSEQFLLVAYDSNDIIVAISKTNTKFQIICDMPCQTCSGGDTSDCLTCYGSSYTNKTIKYLDTDTNKGYCLDNCPEGYFYNTTNEQCQICDSNCLTCQETSSTTCLSCPVGEYLHDQIDDVCYSDCPNGYYESETFCRACPDSCETCNDEENCLTCNAGYYLYNTLCLDACPLTTYELSSPLRCIDCAASNCLYCNQLQCLACQSPYYLHSGQCYSTCPGSLLPDRTGSCSACICQSCSSFSYMCTSCYTSRPYLLNNHCYRNCPSGMYPDSSDNCVSCPANCLTCSSSSVCNTCEEGYYYVEGLCSDSCPTDYIITINEVTNVSSCEQCQSPCLTCNISVSFCLTCITGYNFHNYTCVDACPSPLHSLDNQCKTCTDECLFCQVSDPYNCTQCQPNYYLYQESCLSSCPSGTYHQLAAKQCVDCNPLCVTCVNGTNCTSCVSGYFLLNWFCYTSCPTTPIFYYQYNGVCTQCQPQCTSCINSPVQCTSCSDSEYIYNSFTYECSFQCIQPYYNNASQCVLCQDPCLTCDRTYDSCASCDDGLYLYNGTCISSCPDGYYANSSDNTCYTCQYPCSTCLINQCISCQSFAYIYKQTCVIECPEDRPYEERGYCTDCVGIGFCAVCGQSQITGKQICTECVYPYVLFDDQCLNQCPTNYTVEETVGDGGNILRQCVKSDAYLQYLQELKAFNRPLIPPGIFIGCYGVVCLILFLVTSKIYNYTYHIGYLLSILVIFDTLCLYYSLYFVLTRYTGQYIPKNPQLPLILIIAAIALNQILLSIIYGIVVLARTYFKDIRYRQWLAISPNPIYWFVFIFVLMPGLGGHRLHKIHYSKLFGLDLFSYRIVSVEKFYWEDVLTLACIFGDLLFIAAMAICVFNVFIQYNGLLTLGYECLAIKILLWLLIFYDLKKPDRGFFKGDQAQAEEQIQKQLQQQERKLQRVDTNDLAKLIRTKSAVQLQTTKLYTDLDIDDFMSVYNPDDYEEVPKVPNKKIQKNIYKGKYRRGKKITIDQKLNRFIDQIKPLSKLPKKKVDSYLKDLIYWKPPQIRVAQKKKIVPDSEESMLALLNQKELEYREQIQEVQLAQQQKKKGYYVRPRYNQHNFLDDVDETIPNETVEFFYPSRSIQSNPRKQSIDFDDLMNVNYARKKHLNKKGKRDLHERQESMRVLHHEPQKKRKNALSGIGQMIMKKF